MNFFEYSQIMIRIFSMIVKCRGVGDGKRSQYVLERESSVIVVYNIEDLGGINQGFIRIKEQELDLGLQFWSILNFLEGC